MILKVDRVWQKDDYTIGRLFVDGEFLCNTLEPPVRPDGIKINGKTAIPFGVYDLALSYSPRFQTVLPLVLNVPNFEGVRIHAGNFVSDTEGCLILGRNTIKGGVTESRFYVNALITLMKECDGEMKLEIVGKKVLTDNEISGKLVA